MWGDRRRLESRLDAAHTQLTSIIAQFTGHVSDCANRGAETARKLDKLEGALERSSRERQESIEALDHKFEAKHRENRKYLFSILVTVLGALAVKLLDFVHITAAMTK